MKKVCTTISIFLLGFWGMYMTMCYLMPGTESGAVENMAESLKYNVFFKCVISAVVGLFVCRMPKVFGKGDKK